MDHWTLITYHYLPENTAGSERVDSLANYFSLHEGRDVSVITFNESETLGQARLPNSSLKIHRLNALHYDKRDFVRRAFGEICNSLRIMWYARKIASERVLISIPSMFLMLLAPTFLGGKTLVLDIRDLVWDYLPQNSLFLRCCKWILLGLVRNRLKCFELILVTNSSQAERLKLIVPSIQSRIKLVENGISRARFEGLENARSIIQKEASEVREPFTITSVGNVGMSLHIETLIQVAAELPADEFKFFIVGDGTRLQVAIDLVSEKALKNVHIIGQIDWNELSQYYASTDLLYLQVNPDYESSRPVRIYEYLATGLPIILAASGAASQLAMQFDNIFNIEACCKVQLRNLLLKLKKAPISRFCVDNVTKIAADYIRENQLQVQLKDALSSLAKSAVPTEVVVPKSIAVENCQI